MNDGEGGFIVVVHPKDVAGFEPLQEDADIDTVLRLSYLENSCADIKNVCVGVGWQQGGEESCQMYLHPVSSQDVR